MYIELTDLSLIGLVAALLIYWWRSQGMKQYALHAVKQHCSDASVQLLDETLVLKRVKLKRNASGKLAMLRRFDFEFTSSGNDRYRGHILLAGYSVEQVYMDPYRIN